MAADPTSKRYDQDIDHTLELLTEIRDELQLLRAAVELQQPGVDAFDLVGNEYDGKLPG